MYVVYEVLEDLFFDFKFVIEVFVFDVGVVDVE